MPRIVQLTDEQAEAIERCPNLMVPGRVIRGQSGKVYFHLRPAERVPEWLSRVARIKSTLRVG